MINEDDVNTYVAKQLLSLRQTMGITQAQLAEEIGVSTQQVQKYERGHNRLIAGRLMNFADAFEVSVLVFFPERDHSPVAPVPPSSVRFIRLLNRIAPQHHGELYMVLKALVKFSTGQAVEDDHA